VGRAHGLDGSFYVDAPEAELLVVGAYLSVAGRAATVVRRGGTDARPLVQVSGVEDRAGAEALRGAELVTGAGAEPGSSEAAVGEWDFSELVGCQVPGIGSVRRVVAAPSCDVLEVGDDAVLVPLVADAVRRVDPAAGVIEVDLRFLGLDPGPGPPARDEDAEPPA
jgi:16S rRNA processing protein RimM